MLDSHDRVDKVIDIVILEGTGRCAVGSIVVMRMMKMSDVHDRLIFQDYPLMIPAGFPLVNFIYRCNFFLVIILKGI